MLRRTGLTRKTPLASSGAGLAARAPLARVPLPRRTPDPARRRPTPRPTGPDRGTRQVVHERDQGRCVRCTAPASNTHHREGRGMGGRQDPLEQARINSPAYLLSLCGSGTTGCHGWVETNRTQARAEGYLLRRNAPRPAATVPVLTAAGWELFTDTGHRIPTTAPAEENP